MLDLGVVKSKERWEKHVWAIRLRATTLLGVTFVYLYLAATGRVPLNGFAVALILGLFAFNAHRKKRPSRSFTRMMIGADVVLITLALWATGGVATFLLPLYFVQVVATSLHTNPQQGVLAAFSAWALFAGVALLEAAGVLPHGPLAASPAAARLATDVGFVEASILSLFVLLGAVTYSAGYIAQRLRVREAEIEVAHEELGILYQASQGFVKAETADELAHHLTSAAVRLGARSIAIFIAREEGIECLASRPARLEPEVLEALQGRAATWLNQAGDDRALGTLRDDPNFGLVQFRLGSGRRGVVAVEAHIDDLLGKSPEGLSLLAQGFAAALTTLEALETHVHLATTDPLTGAANRREFDRVIEEETSRAGRYGRPLALVMVDVDHFKKLNDTRGHQDGDRVLVGVVQALRRALRTQDMIARFGGEEFAVIAPETGPDQAVILAERLRRAVQSWDYWAGEDGAPAVTASLGVASRLPTTGPLPSSELLRRADVALYHAKRSGRNRVEFYVPEIDPELAPPVACASAQSA